MCGRTEKEMAKTIKGEVSDCFQPRVIEEIHFSFPLVF